MPKYVYYCEVAQVKEPAMPPMQGMCWCAAWTEESTSELDLCDLLDRLTSGL